MMTGKINVPKQVNLPIRKRFSKVAIITNKRYAPALKFQSKNVLVFVENDVTFGTLKATIQNKANIVKGSVLWLAFTGIHSLADECKFQFCNLSQCKNPLQCFELEKDYYDERKKKDIISDLITTIVSLQEEVKSCLAGDSDFQIMPPLPISILTNKYLTHDQIHSKLSRIEDCFIVVHTTNLTILSDVYAKFCSEVWKEVLDKDERLHSLLGFYNKFEYVSILKDPTDKRSNVIIKLYAKNVEQFMTNSLMEKSPPATRKPLHLSTHSLTVKYDQTMLIANQATLSNFSRSLPPKCTIFNAKFPLNWIEICDGLTVYKSRYKKILFIIVADLSVITTEKLDEGCASCCPPKLSYLSLEPNSVEFLVNSNIQSILDIKGKLEEYFQDSNCVSVAPLFPRICIRIPYLKSQSFHHLMHKVATHISSPIFLHGQMSTWDNSVDLLRHLWRDHFATTFSSFIDSGENLRDIYETTPLVWQLCSELSLDEKSALVEEWEKYIGNVVNTSTERPTNDKKPNAQSKSVAKTDSYASASVASNSKNANNNGRSLDRYIVNDRTSKGYVIGGSNFLNVLTELRNFDNINFLKKSFSNADSLNVDLLLSELGVVNASNVYFFVFDISYITTEIHLRQCAELKCPERHIALTAPFLGEANCDILIRRYVAEIDDFLKSFNTHAVALPLPLPPSQIFCNLQYVGGDHTSLQWIYKQAHFALGEQTKWEAFLSSFKYHWNTLLLGYYGRYENSLNIIKKYLKKIKNLFQISMHAKHFTGDISAYEKWITTVNNLVLTVTTEDVINKKQVNRLQGSSAAEWRRPSTKFGTQFDLNNQAGNAANGAMEQNCRSYTLGQPALGNIPQPHMGVKESVVPMPPNVLGQNQMNINNFQANIMQPHNRPFINNMQPNNIQFANNMQQMRPNEATYVNNMNILGTPFANNVQALYQNQVPFVSNIPPNEAPFTNNMQQMTGIAQPCMQEFHQVPQPYLGEHLQMTQAAVHGHAVTHMQQGHLAQPAMIFGQNTTGQEDAYMKNYNSKMPASSGAFDNPDQARVNASASKNKDVDFPGPFDKVKKPDVSIAFTGITATFPIALLLDFASDASKKARVLEQKQDYLKMQFPYGTAHLVVHKLDNVRIGDCYLHAKFVSDPSMKPVVPNDQQNIFITGIYNKMHAKWSHAIATAMEKLLIGGLDVGTFKTRKCLSACNRNNTCNDYHYPGDKRRNPLRHNYSSDMCTKWNKEGRCNQGNECKFSHNLYEQMYHPNNFQTLLCMSSSSGDECPKYPFCKFAHVDTPEMLFTKYWTDLILFGLQNTFMYVAGALKASIKLPKTNSYKIFCLSPNEDYLKLLRLSLKQLSKEYGMSVILMDNRDCTDDSFNIYLGTPSNFINSSLKMQFQTSASKNNFFPSALIVDDVEAIFKSAIETESLHSFFQRLRSSPKSFATLQKVFVVARYSEKSSGTISRFFGVNLKTVNKTDLKSIAKKETPSVSAPSSKNLPQIKSSPVASTSFVEEKKSDESVPMEITIIEEEPPIVEKIQSVENRTTQSGERKHDFHQQVFTERKSAFTSQKCTLSGQTPTIIVGKSTKCEKTTNEPNIFMDKRKLPATFEDQTKTIRRRSRWNPKDAQFRDNEPLRHGSEVQCSSTQNQEDLTKDFMEAKLKLIKEHEEETRVFKELPEIHPSYEKTYEKFLSYYRKEFSKRRDEDHLNRKWEEYWGKFLNSVKNEHLEKKILILKEALGINVASKQEVTIPPPEISGSEDEFTVAKTLDILEELKDKFGILGHSLQQMIILARNFGADSDQALEVFADQEHAEVCKIIVDKMKTLKNTSRYTGPIYDLAIKWTNELLDKAEKYKNKEGKINVQEIAKVTLGKGPSFTLELIKRKLSGAGNSEPTKELINKLYLEVCSAHFNITMGQD